jgi:hypothetical protein
MKIRLTSSQIPQSENKPLTISTFSVDRCARVKTAAKRVFLKNQQVFRTVSSHTPPTFRFPGTLSPEKTLRWKAILLPIPGEISPTAQQSRRKVHLVAKFVHVRTDS